MAIGSQVSHLGAKSDGMEKRPAAWQGHVCYRTHPTNSAEGVRGFFRVPVWLL